MPSRRASGALQPQSFYFSGYPLPPANAPIVSQNYTDWAPTQPDPARTWDQVSGLDPATLPECQLFDPPAEHPAARRDPGAGADLGPYRPLAAAPALTLRTGARRAWPRERAGPAPGSRPRPGARCR